MRRLTTADLRNAMDRTGMALAFLSRIPVPSSVFARNPDRPLAESAALFPVAGVIISIAGVLALLIASPLPASIAAVIALAAMMMVTGGLHEDGIADCADAFFAPVSRDRRLDIMKDSRIGTFGALALIVQFALGWSALTMLIEVSTLHAMSALAAAAALSRAGIVWHWQVLPFARPSGLAGTSGRPAWSQLGIAAVAAASIAAFALMPLFGWLAAAVTMLVSVVATLAAMILARGKIGGQTGDTLGMTQKLVEVFVLTALAGWVA
jgi:adenosylcobinamide-GDP ribazoletransferase